MSDTVIRLDGNVVWLGMPAVASADLYVRPCYPELFKAREEYIKELKWEQGCMSVFTGTPGVFQDAREGIHVGALPHEEITQRKPHVQVLARVIWQPCL